MALTIEGLEKWYINTVKLKHGFAGTTPPDPIPLPDVTTIDGLLEGLASETEETFVAAAQYSGKYHGETNAYKIQLPGKIYRWYGMKKVGGKTILWNQLFNIANTTKSNNGVTFTATDHVITLSGTAGSGGGSARPFTVSITVVAGHRYVLKGSPSTASDSTYYFRFGTLGYDYGNGALFDVASGETVGNIIITVSAGVDATGIQFKPQLFDLTLMFGAGNEPETVEEFNAIFTQEFYAPNAGELISAGVTDIVSKDADNSVLETITIPSAIKSLTGYGISCPQKMNYIDFEEKKFVQNVGSRTYASGDESDTTVITDGTTTHYPLTTPVETSITIADDIAHADGGSITFENQHSTDYFIPVPVDVRYIG